MRLTFLFLGWLVVLAVGCSDRAGETDGAGGDCNEPGLAECYDFQQEHCAQRSVGDCDELDYCFIVSGSRLDEETGCFEGGEQLGCAAFGCTGLITYSRHDGSTWRFSSGCLPRGWAPTYSVDGDTCSAGGAGGEGGAGGACGAVTDACDESHPCCAVPGNWGCYEGYCVDHVTLP